MQNKKLSKLLVYLLPIILIIGSYFFINKDTISLQEDERPAAIVQDKNEVKMKKEKLGKNEKTEKKEEKKVVSEETKIYEKFKNAIDSNDFKKVGELLAVLYEKGWINKKEFNDLEKEIYVKVDKNYFIPGNFEKSLEITRIIYEQARLSDRFRYLFILSLEALGKKALLEKNYSKAEEYATRILQIMYRPEGVNLLADIYLEKIQNKLKSGDKNGAMNDWNFIMRFELTDEKKKKLLPLENKLK